MAELKDIIESLRQWLMNEVLVAHTLVQLAIVVATLGLSRLLSSGIAPALMRALGRIVPAQGPRAERLAAGLAWPLIWLAMLAVTLWIAQAAKLANDTIGIAVTLVGAWVVIRAASMAIHEPFWAKSFATLAWGIAALSIVDLLPKVIAAMDAVAITLGGLRLSVLSLVESVLTLVVLLWIANVFSRLIARRIGALPSLTPSIQVLTTNLLKILFVTVAVVAALGILGIDLTAFAVFGGAVGVGLGFGLQKIVSNFVSGIIILLDKSVKPGDVIAIGGTYGWINSLSARYVSVITRDGTEHLIPNEELITQRVENWSYSDNLVRVRIPIGISYKSDVRKAIGLCLEAAAEVPRVLKEPGSVCLVSGFGDSSVDLELRCWINDPTKGIANVKSEVYLLVWDKFHEHDIEIPFPQRDLHLKSPEILTVAHGELGGDEP